jgi:hypothetical protein
MKTTLSSVPFSQQHLSLSLSLSLSLEKLAKELCETVDAASSVQVMVLTLTLPTYHTHPRTNRLQCTHSIWMEDKQGLLTSMSAIVGPRNSSKLIESLSSKLSDKKKVSVCVIVCEICPPN